MKKLFYLLLALPLVFAACEEPEQGTDNPVEKTPVLNVTETTLNFEAEGGAGVINYSVENAAENTQVEATCAADWVADLTVAETITFNVAANDGEAREATITVAYGKLSKSVTVKQAAKKVSTAPVFEAVTAEVEIQIKYAGYLARQEKQVAEFKKEESRLLPPDIDYSTIAGLRLEAQEKLQQIRPMSIGQAGRISGVSPADIAVLLIWLETR